MTKILIIALIGIVISLMLKKLNPAYGIVVSILTGTLIFAFLYDDVKSLISVFNSFDSYYGVSANHIKLLLKVLGISYITQFGSSVAEECGEKFLARKIEFAGKIFIISLSMPLLINLLNTVLNLI